MIDRVRKNPLFRAAAIAAALLTLLVAVGCGGGPSKDEPDAYTKDFVQEALDRYEDDGLQATLDYYNSPESIDGQWYVFILDENDLLLAHAAAPQLLGESAVGEVGVDSTGYAFGPVLVAASEAGRWVSYVFRNPESDQEETKHSWAVRRDGLLFGSGWYEVTPGAGAHPPSRVQPDVYTKYVVQQALDRLKAEGPQATIDYYNSAESVDGSWYVFIFDEDGMMVAHPTRPERIGTHIQNRELRTDVSGYYYGDVLNSTSETGRWLTYVFHNPATGEQQTKHTWAIRRDGLLFGSGWYE